MPFDAGAFDFVWSWGVIHHSSSTGRVVREIARVCRPDAQPLTLAGGITANGQRSGGSCFYHERASEAGKR